MPSSGSTALPSGSDPRRLTRRLNLAHDDFLTTGRLDRELRPVVVDSWRRSLRGGLDPETSLAPIRLDSAALSALRATHPLAAAMPVIRRLLVDSAEEAGLLVAVSDAAGQLLWVEGCPKLRAGAEDMHFMPGADWSEGVAGTNAPGTALATDTPVQILGPEHLARPVTLWSCSAAPIHEPDTGAILGVLDITGGPDVARPQTLSLVRATVAAVEAELRLARLTRADHPPVWAGRALARVEVLGRRHARLSWSDAMTDLSLRHSEMLTLISRAPDGLSAPELAVALSETDLSPVTIRAELSRLRTLLGPISLESRPYRLTGELRSDLDEVLSAVTAGRVREAVAHYRGPLLPTSVAPAIAELREDVHSAIRSAVLATRDADALLAFADTGFGRDDFEVWTRALRILPPSSPRHAQVRDHVRRLDLILG